MGDGEATGPDDGEAGLVVSIINYRTGEMTMNCVRSVLADIEGLDARIVVVDNCSGDGSAERIADWIDSLGPDAPVALLRSPLNTGFAGGHNQGIRAARARAYLILNSDAVLRPGAVSALISAMEAHPRAGVIAPRLEDEDGAPQISCFRFHSPISEFERAAQIGAVTRLLRRWVTSLPVPPEPRRIDWVSFACALIRRETLDEVGLLEEGYFLYFDDMDYCWRARRAGWDVVYAPEARVVHYRGGSGPVKALTARRERLPAYFYASRTRFFRLAYGRLGPAAANVLWTSGRVAGLLKRLLGGSLHTVRREWLDLWTNIFDPYGDRRAPKES